MSGFLLSLVSPVLHKMVCGAFKEGASRRLTLGETEERAFVTVVGLACGVASMEVRHVMDAVELAKVADRLQMSEVAEELSGTICRELSVEECAEVLGASGACGLVEVDVQRRISEIAIKRDVLEQCVGHALHVDTRGCRLQVQHAREASFQLLGVHADDLVPQRAFVV